MDYPGENNNDNDGEGSWWRAIAHLFAMIVIYTSSAAISILVIYWLAVWLGFADS
jgi:hypothetical protein